MNYYDEVALRDEVVYLHSLWHQGPPPPRPNPIHPHLPIRSHFQAQHLPFTPCHTRSLPPVTLKKINRKKTIVDPPRSLGPEWPCPASPDPPVTGWPEPKPRSDPPLPEVSLSPSPKLASLQSHHKACQAFKEFLIGSDEEEEIDDNDEDDDGDGDDDDGLKNFEEFFVRVFMEDNGLRRYYQEYFENGEFCCLVCGVVEKMKSLKKFKDCLGLVQHSMSILRTGNKRAHRGFGQAVCKVLGWDIDRLPTIVMKGEPLGCSSESERKPLRTKQNLPAQEGATPSSVAQEESVVDNSQNGGTTANTVEAAAVNCAEESVVDNSQNGGTTANTVEAAAVNCAAQDAITTTASSIEPSIVSSGAQEEEEGSTSTQATLATQFSKVATPEQKKKRRAKDKTLGLNKRRSSDRLRIMKMKEIKGPGATAMEPLVIDQVELPDDPSLGILPTWEHLRKSRYLE